MFRLLIFAFFFAPFLLAENSLLLDTQIKMIPKIMALDNNINQYNDTSTAMLGIVYDDGRSKFATSVAEKINLYYKGKVGSLKFTAIAIHIDELSARRDLSFVYLLDASQSSILQAITISKEKKIPSFVYNIADLSLGALGSISIERSTIITLNKNTLKSGNYHFNDALYQMARWTE